MFWNVVHTHKIYEGDKTESHVLPVDDLRKHEQSEFCPCNPVLEEHPYNLLVIHNSYDNREEFEITKGGHC
jgi:hypothetical protein